jgi:hypothetical protein
MNKADKKLEALKRTYELNEQELLERVAAVENIVGQREAALKISKELISDTEKALHDMRHRARFQALQTGHGARVSSIIPVEERLEKTLLRLRAEEKEKMEELARARRRAEIVKEELIAARIERKKVEKFVDNKQQSERIIDAAREEAHSDELSQIMRRR